MGQCCGFVKTENGINMHQAQFSREIEEHLDKLEKDRIIEAQETSSQIGNNVNQVGSTVGFHDGKDIGHHQSNLSNDIQKQRSADKHLFKKETVYEDYEVKVVEPNLQKDQQLLQQQQSNLNINNSAEKLEKYGSQTSKDLVKLKSQEKRNLTNSAQMAKQESLNNKPNTQMLALDEINIEPISNSGNNSFNYASNEESPNNSNREEETKNAEIIYKGGAPQDMLKKTSLSLQQGQTFQNMNNANNNNNNNNNNSITVNSPQLNQTPSNSPMSQGLKDSFINSGGRKSILLNTLAKKDDPNSGSKSILSQDDLQDKKKEKKVKLVTTSEKRFDTDQRENTEKTVPAKPKGVLKKYDPNSSFSDADSPRTKTKKKVKFKESTFKKQSKKKKRD